MSTRHTAAFRKFVGDRVPTGVDDVRLVARTVRLVLSIPSYAALSVVGALVGLSLFVLPQNLSAVRNVVLDPSIPLPLENRLTVLLHLYPYVGSSFDAMTEALLVTTAALFGVNAALLVYHVRRDAVALRNGTGGAVGMVLGTLGSGCVACGTALISGVFATFGATGLLTALPLEGGEITLLALLALLLSIYWIADGMRGGEIAGCPVDVGGSDASGD